MREMETGENAAAAGIDDRLFVSAAAKAFQVLEAFYGSAEALSLKEIVARTGLGQSATQRQLYTLRTLGYLIQDDKTARFRMSLKAIKLANSYLISDDLLRFSLPYLIEANKVTGQTINLYRRDGLSVVLVQRVSGQQILNPTVTIGASYPLFATAPGRAVLAHAAEAEIFDVLSRSRMQALTPYTSVTAERVMDKILEARARGYASLDQEAVIGNLSIATPVFDRSRSAVAALGISGAAAKFSITEFEREFAAVLRLTAHAITTASGGLMP